MFSFIREQLLHPLQLVIGAVEKRQTMPILANVLLRQTDKRLQIISTDLEIELVADVNLETAAENEVTVPARKLLDICKNLPEGAQMELSLSEGRATLKSGRSRFVLATLPASDFPALEDIEFEFNLDIPRNALKALIEKTSFSMAQQDVRYYLNGLLLECSGNMLRAVATDGHRLALAELGIEDKLPEAKQIIIPRKGVVELQRVLGNSDEVAKVYFSNNHIRIEIEGFRFTSKLIDGRFPDYTRVMPADGDKVMLADRQYLSQSLTRTSILSNEKYRGARLKLGDNTLKIQTQNPDKEEAEEEVEIVYDGEPIEVAFNVNYILDVLNVVEGERVRVELKDANSSCIIRDEQQQDCRYVIMPMRL